MFILRNLSKRRLLYAVPILITILSIYLLHNIINSHKIYLLKCLFAQNLTYDAYRNTNQKLKIVKCLQKMSTIQWCRELKLRNGVNGRVALASFPGSGNTWLRFLLQQATGFYTGSEYIDIDLLQAGLFESAVDEVLLVKTHNGPLYRSVDIRYTAAIILIRDPRESILSLINYENTNDHVNLMDHNILNSLAMNNTKWSNLVSSKLSTWESFYSDWLNRFKGVKLVVYYDQLIGDTESQLRRIFRFLNVTVSESDLYCAMARRDGVFKRRKHRVSFDPFTSDMYRAMYQAKENISNIVNCTQNITFDIDP